MVAAGWIVPLAGAELRALFSQLVAGPIRRIIDGADEVSGPD